MKLSRLRDASLLIILALSLQAMAVTPPSYPLRVRSGKGMRVWVESTQTTQLVKMIVTFQAGTGPAGSGLRPGQGSWMDRGMRSGEPTRLEYLLHEIDAQRILDYLRSPGNYYVFECFNTGKGFFQVTKAYLKIVRID